MKKANWDLMNALSEYNEIAGDTVQFEEMPNSVSREVFKCMNETERENMRVQA